MTLTDSIKAKLINLAYEIGNETSYYTELTKILTILNPINWQILFNSFAHKDTSMNAYKAIAFYNLDEKHVHIAIAGTDIFNLLDLKDVALVISGVTPNKLSSAQRMLEKIIEKLDDELGGHQNFTFSTSGHSLGAILSDLTATEILSKNLKFHNSTTYENLGSRPAIEHAINNKYFNNNITIQEIAEKSVVYIIKENILNQMNPHLGEVRLVVFPPQEASLSGKMSSYCFGHYAELYKNHAIINFIDMKGFISLNIMSGTPENVVQVELSVENDNELYQEDHFYDNNPFSYLYPYVNIFSLDEDIQINLFKSVLPISMSYYDDFL